LRSASLLLFALAACAHAHGEPSARLETACVGEPSARLETVRVGEATFELRYAPEDAQAAKQVRAALGRAVPAAERWGRLSGSVVVTIHPTHQALEGAAQRSGYAWLRAWTRYGSVDLQSPRTWSRGMATDDELAQLLAHEITHCVMYRSAASESTWRSVRIPLWFREGMATVTAGERAHVGPSEIGRFYREAAATSGPAGDPLSEPELLYRSRAELVYGTAQSAFQFLLDRYGEERIRSLLERMAAGSDFGAAFQGAVGIPIVDFEREYRHYVLWRGSLALGPRGS
jgi:hypothetical protein